MSEPTVVSIGADMFADAVAGQAVPVERVDWRPPMPGTEADLAAVATDPRRPAANQKAVEAMLGVTAHLPPSCSVSSRASSSTPDPPSSGSARPGPCVVG